MAKGRKPLSVGMKQNKEDFDRELKTYSKKALKNIITIAENSFDANTRLKANMFLIEKAVGKNYSVLEHNNDAELFFASLFCIKLQKVFVGCCTCIL